MDRYDRERWREERRERRRGRDRFHGHGGLLGGVILAGIGVVLLLQNLGIPFFDDLERYWPLILIVVGFAAAARAIGVGGRIWGGVVFSVGIIFLLKNFEVIHGDVWRFVWPGVLIVIGLGMLARSIDRHNSGASNPGAQEDYAKNLAEDIKNRVKSRIDSSMGGRGTSSSLNQLNEWAIFSGVRRRIDSQDFQGGEAFAMFGGIELDLRKAASTREEIVVEVNAIFGGVEVRVPENWNVSVRGAGIFGGYEDKTMDMRGAPDSKQPHLVVHGFAVFGGVTIQN
jgi:predicted membrane protein